MKQKYNTKSAVSSDLAQRLLEVDCGYQQTLFNLKRRPMLEDLWPVDQEKYLRMATKMVDCT